MYSIFLALLIFVCLGFFVEYAWFGILLVISAWALFAYKRALYLAGVVLSCFLLVFVNFNYFAVLAIPMFFLLARVNINFPRWRNAFYVFYPAHLWVLYLM